MFVDLFVHHLLKLIYGKVCMYLRGEDHIICIRSLPIQDSGTDAATTGLYVMICVILHVSRIRIL